MYSKLTPSVKQTRVREEGRGEEGWREQRRRKMKNWLKTKTRPSQDLHENTGKRRGRLQQTFPEPRSLCPALRRGTHGQATAAALEGASWLGHDGLFPYGQEEAKHKTATRPCPGAYSPGSLPVFLVPSAPLPLAWKSPCALCPVETATPHSPSTLTLPVPRS